jgi:AcrR family transcriptional regulator
LQEKGLTATQRKLLEAGKREFLEKGFKSASLRNIVREAGFTLGAFYGYYRDKEALFNALAAPADGLTAMFKAAQDAHFDLIGAKETRNSRRLSTEYLRRFIDYVYDNFDAFRLVVCCAEGTKYQSYIHDLVELEVRRSKTYFAELRKRGKLKGRISGEIHHMLTSAYFTAVFEVIAHNMERKKALGYIDQVALFFNSGWDSLIQFL